MQKWNELPLTRRPDPAVLRSAEQGRREGIGYRVCRRGQTLFQVFAQASARRLRRQTRNAFSPPVVADRLPDYQVASWPAAPLQRIPAIPHRSPIETSGRLL